MHLYHQAIAQLGLVVTGFKRYHGITIPWSDDRGHIELSVVPFGLLHAKIEP